MSNPVPPSEEPPAKTRYVVDQLHPLGGGLSDILLGLFRRFQLTELTRYHNSTVVMALFSFINGCFSIGLMAVVALVTRAPFIFPSLGPTAFLLFFTPQCHLRPSDWGAGRLAEPGDFRAAHSATGYCGRRRMAARGGGGAVTRHN